MSVVAVKLKASVQVFNRGWVSEGDWTLTGDDIRVSLQQEFGPGFQQRLLLLIASLASQRTGGAFDVELAHLGDTRRQGDQVKQA